MIMSQYFEPAIKLENLTVTTREDWSRFLLLTDLFHIIGLHDVYQTSIFVCKNWLQSAESDYIPSFKALYLRYYRNLILNPDAARGLENWDVRSGGSQICVEEQAIGADSIPFSLKACWVASYMWANVQQDVDLSDLDPLFLDSQPCLHLSFLFTSRNDQDVQIAIAIKFYDINLSTLSTSRSPIINYPASGKWRKWSWVERIPIGTRSLSFQWSGKDRQFWAGNYGPKLTHFDLRFRPCDSVIRSGIQDIDTVLVLPPLNNSKNLNK
uniref:FBA domain-containing protein n=1 Tax=Spongospora subterranea TaxID=70186 RepID=A0A0H5QTK1_9EUKA|eukprot:CRZ04891.1 hypothetical protein [Spongospora subterranea]